jgi:hypothetical protein
MSLIPHVLIYTFWIILKFRAQIYNLRYADSIGERVFGRRIEGAGRILEWLIKLH